MANQIIKKFIGDNQIDADKILLDNNTGLKSKDSMGALEKDLIKLDGSDKVVITDIKDPTSDFDAAHKKYVDDQVAGGGQALQDHINDASDAHDASAISVVPTGNLAASDVQAALEELQGDLDGIDATYVNVTGDTMTGQLVVEDNSGLPNLVKNSLLSGGELVNNYEDTSGDLYNYSNISAAFLSIGSETLNNPSYQQFYTMTYTNGKLSLIENDTDPMTPVNPEHAATKQYVDDTVNSGGQALQDHINDITGAHAASAISVAATGNLGSADVQSALQELQGDIDNMSASGVSYDNSVSMMSATNVQQGIDELDLRLDNLTASQVAFTAAGNISSVHVQTAIEELDTEKVAKSGDTMSGNLDMNSNNINGLPVPLMNGQPLVFDQLGVGNGVTPLNVSGKIDSIYLPSYVDDVEEYANLAAFPVSGEASKIYVALDSNKTYRWSGSTYVEISPSEVNSVNGQFGVVSLDTDDISEGASNLYYTQSRFDSAFSGKNTDNLSEGSSNLYFTDARAKTAAVFDGITDGITDVAPSQNAVFDALALKFDSANFNSSFDSQLSSKDTDDLAEGSSNLYFTDARAKTAAVNDTAYGISWDGVTDVAPSKNAVYDEMQLAKSRLDVLEDIVWIKEKFVITTGQTTVTLSHLPEMNSLSAFVDRLAIHEGIGEDYTLSGTTLTILNPGTGNNQIGNGDTIYVKYQYQQA